MKRIWLDSYPPGVPADIGAPPFASIGQLFEHSVARYARLPAFVCMGRRLTYDELDALSSRFAAYLQGGLKLPRGTRVALMMPNVLQYPIAMFGALRAGYIVVNINPLYTARELEHQLRDSGAEVVVILENFAHLLQLVRDRLTLPHVVITSLGELLPFPKRTLVNLVVRRIRKLVPAWRLDGAVRFATALAQGKALPLQPVAVGADDIAYLQYTGGTTGVAKGAILTHGNILANLQQAQAWLKPHVREGGEVIITALPLYHIFSLTANCLTFFSLGACNVLIPNPRDIAGLVEELGRHRFTVITGVNTLFNALLNNPDFARLDFSALHIALGGGMALQQAVAERWQQVTGRTLIEAYGLTEASPAVTINPLDLPVFNHAVGLPIPSTEVSIRDDDDRELEPGMQGELCVRGPQVCRAYWNRPEDSASAFTADGFLRTGDVAVIDVHGFVHIVDRKKDMILVSGFNVYPSEIEDVIAAHPGVLEVAAVGVADAHSGEAVKVYIVRRDPGLSAADIEAWCRQGLAAYKVPRAVEFRNELPKSNVGKILRRMLRDG